jgi:hypothetical protein
MEKTYRYAGVSRLDGEFKVRFSDRDTYVKALAKADNTDIDIVELRTPMVKLEAIQYLNSIDFAQGRSEVQAALDLALETRTQRATPAQPRAPRVPGVPRTGTKMSLEAIRARAAQLAELADAMERAQVATPADSAHGEDAPF